MNNSCCKKCRGFGKHQIYYHGRVELVYCQCPAGRKRIERMRKFIESIGEDPYSDYFHINREPNI